MHILGTFQFSGPNWQSDFAAREWLVVLTGKERSVLREGGANVPRWVGSALEGWGIQPENLSRFHRPLPENARARFAFLLNSVAIALQRHAGHKVYRAKRLVSKEAGWVRALYEVEDAVAGEVAGRLALHLLSRSVPGLKFQAENLDPMAPPGELVEKFRAKFARTALPGDTVALMRAAERAGVPWIRLDQPPFSFRRDPGRIRRTGNLLLGQGVNRHIIDRTLCLDLKGSKARPFLDNRVSIGRMLARLGATLPHDGREPPVANGLLEAIQITERLGYPVVLKPVKRAMHEGVTLDVRSIGDLMQAVSHAQSVSRPFLVQRHIKGPTWRIMVSNGQFVGLLRGDPPLDSKAQTDASIKELAQNIAHQLKVGLLVLTVVTPDISRPLDATGGAVVDLDLAPEFDRILKPNSKWWKPLMDGFIESLYPPDVPSRIPIIAVTGTKGGTATSRLIDVIMRQAGFNSALSCSAGLYLAGQKIRANESAKRLRETHYRVIRNRKADLAVMEFRLSQLKSGGFPFDWCNVSVMTDVAADEVQPGWETARQIAMLARAVPERARDGVVLNADDPHAPYMLQHLDAAKIILTSSRQSAAEVRADNSPAGGFVTLEHNPGGGRIMISEDSNQIDLMGLTEMPATLAGATEFTLDCVLQAIAAGHLMKVPHSVIRTAISSFE